jgi:hypothetical protein
MPSILDDSEKPCRFPACSCPKLGCAAVIPAPITQWRNLPVPYAVSAASRSGLSPNRSSVRLIIVLVKLDEGMPRYRG